MSESLRLKSANSGFTLTEIMIAVAIIGLLVMIALPNLVRARESTFENMIINNLRLIQFAKDSWAAEENKSPSEEPSEDDLKVYFRPSIFPEPVVNETYVIGPVEDKPYADLSFPLNGQMRIYGSH